MIQMACSVAARAARAARLGFCAPRLCPTRAAAATLNAIPGINAIPSDRKPTLSAATTAGPCSMRARRPTKVELASVRKPDCIPAGSPMRTSRLAQPKSRRHESDPVSRWCGARQRAMRKAVAPTDRMMKVPSPAPATPIFGIGPKPQINVLSAITLTPTSSINRYNGVRVSPAPRKAAPQTLMRKNGTIPNKSQ